MRCILWFIFHVSCYAPSPNSAVWNSQGKGTFPLRTSTAAKSKSTPKITRRPADVTDVISWTPGVEVNRMTIDGQEIVFRVVKGHEGKLGEVPYQISFRKKMKSSSVFASFCGGTLISPREVISAAHCFHRSKFTDICYKSGQADQEIVDQVYAVAGILKTFADLPRTDYEGSGQWRPLRAVYYPTNYHFPDHDVAVVFLKEDFEYNEHVSPLHLATRPRDYTGMCTISGFGRISASTMSPHLKVAEVRVLTKSTCDRIHREDMSKFICSSDEVSDIGKGDSGGPLVCKGTHDPNETERGVLVGIVSGKNTRRKDGSFFVRVTSYNRFITEKLINNMCIRIKISAYVMFLTIILSPLYYSS